MEKYKVAIVDDHQLFRDGLREIINGFPSYEVIMDAGDGQAFIDKLNQVQRPDIVLLDVNMKPMDGYATAQWLRTNQPNILVLALSMYDSEVAVIRMLKSGARGYLQKDVRRQELHDALIMLTRKGYYSSDMVSGSLMHMIGSFDNNADAKHAKEVISLTAREMEFLRLACSEWTYKEIADQMGVSRYTVDGYRDSLFDKLQVKSRVGLVLYAIRQNIFMVQ
jgi:two-component system invasion response regulator UvrY